MNRKGRGWIPVVLTVFMMVMIGSADGVPGVRPTQPCQQGICPKRFPAP